MTRTCFPPYRHKKRVGTTTCACASDALVGIRAIADGTKNPL